MLRYGNFGASSETLVFNETGCPRVKVEKGDPLWLWYGEDFLNIGEKDNIGRVCADIRITYKAIACVENPVGLTGKENIMTMSFKLGLYFGRDQDDNKICTQVNRKSTLTAIVLVPTNLNL